MTTVLSRNLLSIGSIYRVPGGQLPPTNIDFASPIPLVHDVHREAELGGGPGAYFGFWNSSLVNTHAIGPGTVYSSQTLLAPYVTLGNLDQQQYWTWVMEVTVLIASTLTMTEAWFVIQQGGIAGALSTHIRPIARFDGQSTGLATPAGQLMGTRTGAPPYTVSFPVLFPRESNLTFGSTAGGAAANVTGQALVYTCPVGTLPPGMA